MADERLVQLLQDCDAFLVTQRTLLVQATALGNRAGSVAAMNAALDQLASGVAVARGEAMPEDLEEPAQRRRGDPGE